MMVASLYASQQPAFRGGGAPSPVTFLDDTFTDTSETSILSHSPEVGGAWLLQTGYSPATNAKIDPANRLYAPLGNSCYYNAAVPGSDDYYVEANLDCLSALASDNVGITGRASTSANTMYLARYSRLAGAFNLLKLVAGVATTLGSFTQTFTSGSRKIRLTMIGTTISVKLDDVEVISVTDSAIASGMAGVRYGTNQTTTTGIHINDITAVA